MSEGVDKLVSVLDSEGVTVVTKEINSDVKDMAKRAYDLFVKGNYDMIVAVPDNSVVANMAFNKFEGASAAVCDSVEEASVAKENDANVIIIKNPDSEELGDILATVTKKAGFHLGKVKLPSRPVMSAQHRPHQEEEMHEEPEPKREHAQPVTHILQPKPQAPRPPVERVQNIPAGPSRPGVMGWVKDSLGIIDRPKEEQHDERQSQHADAAKAKHIKKEKAKD